MNFLAMVTEPMITAVPKDAVVNTWHFNLDTDNPGSINAIQATLVQFYNAVSGLYPGAVAQNGWTTKFYNLLDAKPRPPRYQFTWNLTAAPVGSELPHELAICMSFQGDRAAGIPQSRRRGRVYLGPIDTTAMTGAMVATSTQTTIRDAGQAMNTVSDGAADWKWVVYSAVALGSTTVTNGWVDNGMDIQRRRGVAALTRLTWA